MNKERDSALPSRLLMLFQLMAVLRAGRWTITQLTERFDCGKSTIYRYLELLEEAGFCVEKDFHHRYFVMTTDDDPVQAQFTVEELSMVRSLLQREAQHPLAASVLKKLSLQSELDAMPQLFLKAHLGNLVEQLTHAMQHQHQVILKNYHSANSDVVRDRLVEPFSFGANFGTLLALDVKAKVCKQFKLDRIGEIEETHHAWQYRTLHQAPEYDAFGLSGNAQMTITLRLTARAYLLLKEEYLMTLPYLKAEKETYTFSGPVASYAGIGRFVMGLMDEIEIVSPVEFTKYVRGKMGTILTMNPKLSFGLPKADQ